MGDYSDYHNKYIQLEGSDTKYYITEFDLEAKLTARVQELEAKIERLEEAGDKLSIGWMITIDDGETIECQYCHKQQYDNGCPPSHDLDCPIILWNKSKDD